jgi:hypothetical protein
VPADRLLVIEVVEGDDPIDFGDREVEFGGDRRGRLGRQPPPLALDDVEGRQRQSLALWRANPGSSAAPSLSII